MAASWKRLSAALALGSALSLHADFKTVFFTITMNIFVVAAAVNKQQQGRRSQAVPLA